jgi:hypothetical protein
MMPAPRMTRERLMYRARRRLHGGCQPRGLLLASNRVTSLELALRLRMYLSTARTESSVVVRSGVLHPDRLVDKRSSTTREGRCVTRVTANQVTNIDEHNHYV